MQKVGLPERWILDMESPKIKRYEQVILSSYQQEIGSVEENLASSFYKGEPLTISFSCKYASDAIKSFSGDKIKILFTGEMKPFIVKDFDSDELLQLVLPVRTY